MRRQNLFNKLIVRYKFRMSCESVGPDRCCDPPLSTHGMVLEQMTSSSAHFSIRSSAAPLNNPVADAAPARKRF